MPPFDSPIRAGARIESAARAHAIFDMDLCIVAIDATLARTKRPRVAGRRALAILRERAIGTRERLAASTGPSDPAHQAAYADQLEIEDVRDDVIMRENLFADILRDERGHPLLDAHEAEMASVRALRPATIARGFEARALDQYILQRINQDGYAAHRAETAPQRRRDADRRRRRARLMGGQGWHRPFA